MTAAASGGGGGGEMYTTIKEIGKGSFGRALLVKDQSDKCFVMKTVDMSRMTSTDRQKALNEARVLETVRRHPFVIRFYRSFEKDKQLCLVMDYAPGGDLHGKIVEAKKRQELIPEDKIMRWFAQMCLGVKELHDLKILHRGNNNRLHTHTQL
eukprot:GHVQ01035364.1.p1 GENE.GHVQ01035364.1~~GHVQ01035364.1.p1  ORF type:complete len:153 (+),score=27.19 GHVQ01035364.1:79-537(+)